ncbi:MAG: hypothetical protein KatS3mg038_2955 [Candidatus Kapaibacterium sp.]|nr:MAG: hypothetical protein KatS3mg038_2955 [Candidatus Kapabacteria bacterium]
MPLPDKTLYSTPLARNTGITNIAIPSGNTAMGSVVNNDSDLNLFANVDLVWSYGIAPASDKLVEVHILYALDGINFEELSSHTVVAGLSPPADTAAHRRLLVRGLRILPHAFKLAIRNVDTGQTITVTASMSTYSLQQVD